MFELLRLQWEEKCASDKREHADSLEVIHEAAVEQLKDDTEDEHQVEIQQLIQDMTAKCDGRQERFKQEYAVKYESDIAELSTTLNLQI